MFITSIVAMIFTLAYVYQHRRASLEAVEKGELSAPRIAFSLRGEAVNLYLRFGIGCKFKCLNVKLFSLGFLFFFEFCELKKS
ncbi:unnamed protein product [Trichobilharzia regenti]|nr:unnamed protein product [Trichobilharzia regenti]